MSIMSIMSMSMSIMRYEYYVLVFQEIDTCAFRQSRG